ncbi:MAG: hypothetical protein NT047_00720 [Deltaproteobacteria bacterium]|nr:hypothetical protein [Deltaproteobacteria bacterium]
MGDEAAEKKNIPPGRRKELNELVQRYAESHRIPYNQSWRELADRFYKRYHAAVYVMKHSYCEDNKCNMNLPEFLEETNWMNEALEIAREMSGAAAKS